jgi:hypothetical protein
MSIEELRTEALKLNTESRAFLARELLASLDNLSVAEVESLWIDEAIRRDNDLDEGHASAHPADEVLSRLRNRLC